MTPTTGCTMIRGRRHEVSECYIERYYWRDTFVHQRVGRDDSVCDVARLELCLCVRMSYTSWIIRVTPAMTGILPMQEPCKVKHVQDRASQCLHMRETNRQETCVLRQIEVIFTSCCIYLCQSWFLYTACIANRVVIIFFVHSYLLSYSTTGLQVDCGPEVLAGIDGVVAKLLLNAENLVQLSQTL